MSTWKQAYDELVKTIVYMGYPREFGDLIARSLGGEKAMDRMTRYLMAARPSSMEEIADEMLAIRSEIGSWREKKEAEYYNGRYNAMRESGIIGEDE